MITTHIMISMLLILVAVLVPVIYFKKSKHILNRTPKVRQKKSNFWGVFK